MIAVEKVREWIIHALFAEPKLEVNYIDWHTDNLGECGVTIYPCGEEFEIIIKKK